MAAIMICVPIIFLLNYISRCIAHTEQFKRFQISNMFAELVSIENHWVYFLTLIPKKLVLQMGKTLSKRD